MESSRVVQCVLLLLLSLQCIATVPVRPPVVAIRDHHESDLGDSEPDGTNPAPLVRDCLFACARQPFQKHIQSRCSSICATLLSNTMPELQKDRVQAKKSVVKRQTNIFSMSCTSMWNISTHRYNLNISWTMMSGVPTKRFRLQWRKENAVPPDYNLKFLTTDFHPEEGVLSYFRIDKGRIPFKTYEDNPLKIYYKLRVVLSTPVEGDDRIDQSCIMDITPPPPSVIQNLTATVKDIQWQQFGAKIHVIIHGLSLQWLPPSTMNTNPASLTYQLGIVSNNSEKVLDIDATSANNSLAAHITCVTFSGSGIPHNISIWVRSYYNTTVENYTNMEVVNVYSSWSDPVLLEPPVTLSPSVASLTSVPPNPTCSFIFHDEQASSITSILPTPCTSCTLQHEPATSATSVPPTYTASSSVLFQHKIVTSIGTISPTPSSSFLFQHKPVSFVTSISSMHALSSSVLLQHKPVTSITIVSTTTSLFLYQHEPVTSITTISPTYTPTSSVLLQHETGRLSLTLAYICAPIAITLLIVVLGLIFIACVVFSRNKRKRLNDIFGVEKYPEWLPGFGNSEEIPLTDDSLCPDKWEIPPRFVTIEEKLGEGEFGEVFKGVIQCDLLSRKLSQPRPQVAVKLLKAHASGSEKNDFFKEIELMKKIAEGNNPHVVNMLGCVTIQEPIVLITEFVKYGDLHSYLTYCRKQGTELLPEPSPYAVLGDLDAWDLISFAYQIASGMEYLTSLNVVHRDLACRNILIGHGKCLKITDFGMSRMLSNSGAYVKTSTARLPLKWMAIESIINREFTSASDIWAFGVTLWEISTLGGFPYSTIDNSELLTLLKQGHRLEKPENCSSDVYQIMMACWEECPQARPSFVQLRAKFDTMLGDQKNSPLYIQLFDNEFCCPTDDNRSYDNETTGNNVSSLLSSSQRSCATVGSLHEAAVDTNQFKSIPFNNYVTSPTHAVSQGQLTRPTHLNIPRQSHKGANPLTSPSQFTPGMVTLHLSDFLKPQVFIGGCQSSSHLSTSAYDEN